MILTDIKKPENILGLHPLFEVAVSEMIRLSEADAANGSYKIKGDELIVNIMSYQTKPTDECLFESHRDYIDIQMVMSGEEDIGFASADALTVTTPYTPDYELYAMTESAERVRMTAGKLCVIFPPEPHAPGMAVNESPVTVKKMVAKVKRI